MNHGHRAIITGAQLMAQEAIDVDIRGSSPHTHTVHLDGLDIETIIHGVELSFRSTPQSDPTDFEPHTHMVTFNLGRTEGMIAETGLQNSGMPWVLQASVPAIPDLPPERFIEVLRDPLSGLPRTIRGNFRRARN